VVGTGPATSRDVTAQLFSRLIFDARRKLVISTPYFVPGETVSQAIMGAARAGVDVTLIVPARNDSGFVARASRSYYPGLVDAGVKIVEFNGGLLHSKTLTIDDDVTFMGSSNLDIRSFDLNFENDILLRDKALTEAVRTRQMQYAASSTPVDPARVRAWPLAQTRLVECVYGDRSSALILLDTSPYRVRPILRLHFDQPRGSADELERFCDAGAALIEVVGGGFGADDDALVTVIERIDQQDETFGRVAPGLIHHRHVIDDKGVEPICQRQIVACAKRRVAQVSERKAGSVAASRLDVDLASHQFDVERFGIAFVTDCSPCLVHAPVGFAPERRQVDRQRVELQQAIVDRRVQGDDFDVLLQHIEKRQEQRPVEAILVEIGRRDV
jgi:hypothetical protein